MMRIAMVVLALELGVLGVLAVMVSRREAGATNQAAAGDGTTVTYFCPAGGTCQEERRSPGATQSLVSPMAQPGAAMSDY
jgi:hypothetical protein